MFEVEAISTRKIGGENDFYTIFKDSFICDEEDKKRFEHGESRILDIEHGWNKIENTWPSMVKTIESYINNSSKFLLTEFKRKEIIYFAMTMYVRGNKGVEKFKEILKEFVDKKYINFSDKEIEDINEIINAEEKERKQFLLREMRKLFNEDGLIYRIYKFYEENATLLIDKAKGNIKFITSDNPTFKAYTTIKDKNDSVKARGYTIAMPVTPNILVHIVGNKYKGKKYKISELEDKEVIRVNQMIFENSEEFILSDRSNIFDSLASKKIDI